MIALRVDNEPIDIFVSVPSNIQARVSSKHIRAQVSLPSIIVTVNEVATLRSGADKNYVHTQNIPSTLWIVSHNLGKYPAITVVDSAYNEVDVEVEHVDTNVAKLYMSVALSGKAFCN